MLSKLSRPSAAIRFNTAASTTAPIGPPSSATPSPAPAHTSNASVSMVSSRIRSRSMDASALPTIAASADTPTTAANHNVPWSCDRNQNARWKKVKPQGGGYEFENAIVGGVVPREYISSVDKGIQEQIANGVIAGYPVVDVKVTLFDGSYHEVDSSEMAFKVAGSMAFKNAANIANPVLLEPMMKVEVVTPEDYMGDVMGDLTRRRGVLQGMEDSPAGKMVNAHVPLSEMFGYATDLRSQTQGRATYTMEFDHYSEAPASLAEEIIKKTA